MPESITLSFAHSEPPPSTLALTLEVVDDPDGPDYDFDGTLQVQGIGFQFRYAFACHVPHVQRWCDELYLLTEGERNSAALSNESETVSLVVTRSGEGQEYDVGVGIEDARRPRLTFVGYVADSTAARSAVQQLRKLIASVPD